MSAGRLGVTVMTLTTVALALPAAAWAQWQTSTSISAHRTAAGWQPAAFVCDSTNRDRVMVLSPPDRAGGATLTSYGKPGMATYRTNVTVGRGDPGMGQVFYALTNGDGRDIGNIHTVNPGMVEPGATTPTVTSITYGKDTTDCRFAPQTRVLGATARRSAQITGTGRDGYRYRSYNYDAGLEAIEQPWGGRDTRASLTIDGGRLVDQRDGRRTYEFANAGYVYRVLVASGEGRAGGGVQVWRDGRQLLSDPFFAYTAAAQP